MEYVFVPKIASLQELKQHTEAFEQIGCKLDAVAIGSSWGEFVAKVPDGATVVVYSVDFFPSLMELLSTLAALQEREITLRSLQEPWLSQEVGSTADFLLKLRTLAVRLHQNRTRQGLQKARAAGKTLGRPTGYRKPGRRNKE